MSSRPVRDRQPTNNDFGRIVSAVRSHQIRVRAGHKAAATRGVAKPQKKQRTRVVLSVRKYNSLVGKASRKTEAKRRAYRRGAKRAVEAAAADAAPAVAKAPKAAKAAKALPLLPPSAAAAEMYATYMQQPHQPIGATAKPKAPKVAKAAKPAAGPAKRKAAPAPAPAPVVLDEDEAEFLEFDMPAMEATLPMVVGPAPTPATATPRKQVRGAPAKPPAVATKAPTKRRVVHITPATQE